MGKEFQIRDGNLIASFDLENEDGDIDFCKLLKVSHGVADEIGMFVDYVATNKIIKDQSKRISDLEAKLAEKEKLLEINERILRGTKLVRQELEQEKISFAVEQLEKVKETTECVLDNALKNSSLNQSYYDRLLDEIDNQIKEIKGKK